MKKLLIDFMNNKLKVAEMFAGAGGLALGLEKAG
jgi:site-specific DNA-cytosine methylase